MNHFYFYFFLFSKATISVSNVKVYKEQNITHKNIKDKTHLCYSYVANSIQLHKIYIQLAKFWLED